MNEKATELSTVRQSPPPLFSSTLNHDGGFTISVIAPIGGADWEAKGSSG